MTTVACVLRSGGDFEPFHVKRLSDQVARHSSSSFICVTDQTDAFSPTEIASTPLEHGWPSWWSKLEIFDFSGPILYLDLDVTIIGDLAPLLRRAERHAFVALKNFWVPGEAHKINSSVMAWRRDASALYHDFAAAPDAHRSVYNVPGQWGDQAFIADHWPGKIETWQDLLPGKVCSFKRGALMGEDLSDCRVLVSHGVPRPWAPGGADEWLVAQGRMVA